MTNLKRNSGRVIANYGDALAIENAEQTIYRCTNRRKLDFLVCGDYVEWSLQEDGTGFIETLKPRHTILTRRIRGAPAKPIAANFNQIVITLAPIPEPETRLIDTYLVICENQYIDCVILINKIDLLTDANNKTLQTLETIYTSLDYPVIKIAAKHNIGLAPLKTRLQQHTSILVGQSGVGKSSLIKQLLPDADVQTGHISKNTGLGSHTTTRTLLYHLPDGGELIDSPGVREFVPEDLSKDMIQNGFREFHPYQGLCKFNNCLHINEPKCAVIEALKEKKIHFTRWENYKHLVTESTQKHY